MNELDNKVERLAASLTPQQLKELELTHPKVAGLVRLKLLELRNATKEEIRLEILRQHAAEGGSIKPSGPRAMSAQEKESLADRMAERGRSIRGKKLENSQVEGDRMFSIDPIFEISSLDRSPPKDSSNS